jgi:hypothetical protein
MCYVVDDPGRGVCTIIKTRRTKDSPGEGFLDATRREIRLGCFPVANAFHVSLEILGAVALPSGGLLYNTQAILVFTGQDRTGSGQRFQK